MGIPRAWNYNMCRRSHYSWTLPLNLNLTLTITASAIGNGWFTRSVGKSSQARSFVSFILLKMISVDCSVVAKFHSIQFNGRPLGWRLKLREAERSVLPVRNWELSSCEPPFSHKQGSDACVAPEIFSGVSIKVAVECTYQSVKLRSWHNPSKSNDPAYPVFVSLRHFGHLFPEY